MRWYARVKKCNCDIAALISVCSSSSNSQNWRTSATHMSALSITPFFSSANLSLCIWRAFSTLARISSELSPLRLPDNFSKSTRGASGAGARHFDVDVDSIEYGTGNSFLVARYGGMGAGAGFSGRIIEATWLGMNTIDHFFRAWWRIKELSWEHISSRRLTRNSCLRLHRFCDFAPDLPDKKNRDKPYCHRNNDTSKVPPIFPCIDTR